MKINHNIPNLSGGISQQAEPLRFDNQVESMENCSITVVDGLRKRNPTKLNTTLTGSVVTSNSKTHSYKRGDGINSFNMIVDSSGLKVIGSDGSIKTVTYDATSLGYITSGVTDFKRDIKMLTVGDTTWIVNTKISPKMKAPISTANTSNYTAFYWVKKSFDNGEPTHTGYTYEVVVNGSKKTTNATDTTVAASTLATDISTISGITATAQGSIVRISSSSPFTFSSGDSWGNQASRGWSDTVSKMTDLPASMEGFSSADVGTIAISGTDRDNFTSYYIHWTGKYWTETRKDGIKTLIDETTMPVSVFPNGSMTTFNVKVNTWNDRLKGDDDSNPIPSFINSYLSGMFFFKNRLCFLTDGNVVMSESGSYYNFFGTTAMEIVDSDMIDVAVDSNSVSILRYATISGNAVTLWADNAQFTLSGGDVLSSATTRISQTSSYGCDANIEPVMLDNEIMFFDATTNGLRSYAYSGASIQTDKSTAEELSAHMPAYVSRLATRIEVSSSENTVVFLEPDTNILYTYKYYINNSKRVISAWSSWTFDNTTIRNISIIDNMIYLYVGANEIISLDITPQSISSAFVDYNGSNVKSEVFLSRFNIETPSKSRVITDKFFIKTIKLDSYGEVDVKIQDSERNRTRTVLSKHNKRHILISGNNENTRIGFSNDKNTGFQINLVNISGELSPKTKNI